MKTYKNPIHYREFIIGIAIAVVLIIIGSIPYNGLPLDFAISSHLYSPDNPNWFGVLMSGLAEIPGYLAIVFAGSGLIATRNKENKLKLAFSYIFGIIAIALGTFLTWNTFQNISDFNQENLLFTVIFGIFIVILTAGPIVYFTIAFGEKFQKEILFRVCFIILIIALSEILLFLGLKYLWSRPRPRYLFIDPTTAREGFRAWWQPNPFGAFDAIYHSSSNATSFPSGHTATSTLTAVSVPLFVSLFPRQRNNKYTLIVCFYIGLLWSLLTAFSRVLAGAHFLTDTAFGLMLTLIISVIVIYSDFHLHKVEVKDQDYIDVEIESTNN